MLEGDISEKSRCHLEICPHIFSQRQHLTTDIPVVRRMDVFPKPIRYKEFG